MAYNSGRVGQKIPSFCIATMAPKQGRENDHVLLMRLLCTAMSAPHIRFGGLEGSLGVHLGLGGGRSQINWMSDSSSRSKLPGTEALELLYASLRQLNVYRGLGDADPGYVFQGSGDMYPLAQAAARSLEMPT